MANNKGTRKSNGEGSIRQRSNGSWEARVYVNGRSYSFYGKTKSEAHKKYVKAQSEIDSGVFICDNNITLEAWAKQWLEKYTVALSELSVKSYNDRFNKHIIPYLGKYKLTKIKKNDIQNLIHTLIFPNDKSKKPLSSKTVHCVIGALHKCLQDALEAELIQKNPAEKCNLPKFKKTKENINPIVNETAKRFIELAKNDEYYNIFVVDLMTGLRQGEILGLTWDNINFETNTITVNKQLLHEKKANGKYKFVPPKENKIRTMVVGKKVIDILNKVKEHQQECKKIVGTDWGDDGLENLVFTNGFGKHLCHATIRKHFKKIVEEMGMSEIRFHDLRHSYAIAAEQQSVPDVLVTNNMGHYSTAFTKDVYGGVTKELCKVGAERLDEYYNALF